MHLKRDPKRWEHRSVLAVSNPVKPPTYLENWIRGNNLKKHLVRVNLEGQMRKIFVALPILVILSQYSSNLQAATFNITTPVEFQTALTTARANGETDTINVTAGTYNIGSTLTYDTSENFALSITGAGAATTILDGGNTHQIMNINGNGSGDVSISGLTFQNGRATAGISAGGGLGGAFAVANGNAGNVTVNNCIINSNSSTKSAGGCFLGLLNGDATITNCSITNNSCDEGTADDGGGLYIYFDTGGTGNAIVRNCDISNNTLGDNLTPVGGCDGAGMMIYHLGTGATFTIENNRINRNLSHYGTAGAFLRNPGQTTMVVTGNTCSGNTTGGNAQETQIAGSGMLVYTDGGSVIINNNKFLNNVLSGPWDFGSGLCVQNLPLGTLEMIGNVFSGNQANGNGGGASVNLGAGITSATIIENLFVNNQANLTDGSGGGLSLSAESSVTLVNNTFYGNSAGDGGGLGFYAETAEISAALRNEIYWNNTPNALAVFGAGPVNVQYCNVEGGTEQSWFGTGCIDSDPVFFNTASPQGEDGIYATIDDGLRLTAASPSANAGNNIFVPVTVTTDIAGANRIQNTTVDMGAYEYVGIPIPEIKANNQDGSITISLGASLSITVSLNPSTLSGQNADWWVVESTPSGAFNYYNLSAGAMVPGLSPTHQGPLFTLGTTHILNSSDLSIGSHTFYFAVDLKMNGLLDMDSIYYDSVSVNVVEP